VSARRAATNAWRRALLPAVVISAGVSALYVYWFAVADRYAVFLYDHLGAGPFDPVTTSRYWMCGLVAGGMVTVLYTPLQALLGWLARRTGREAEVPDPVRVWALCAIPLTAVIIIVTMTMNAPTLSAGQAIGCAAATVVALALALAPAHWAAARPADLAWLAADGLGLVPVLLLLRVVELPAQGLVPRPLAVGVAAGSVVASLAWLAVMTLLRAWRHRPRPAAPAVLLAGLSISYLLLPLAHHLLATPPGYRYISTSANFFPSSLGLLAASLGLAALMAAGASRVRTAAR